MADRVALVGHFACLLFYNTDSTWLKEPGARTTSVQRVTIEK